MKNKKSLHNLIGYMLLIAAMIYMAVVFMCAQGDDIWYDEVFSLVFSKSSIKELIYFTANDVHPPFYYIYLKFMAGFLGLFIRNKSYIVLAKLASMIPWVGIFIIAVTYIRKRFSGLIAGLYIFMVTVMPQLGGFYIEIRMYSLAMFLITGAFVAILSIMNEMDILSADDAQNMKIPDKKRAIKEYRGKFLIFFICGILTAYTQYYACVAIIGLYLILLIYLIINFKKNKAKSNDGGVNADNVKAYKYKLKLYLASVIVSVILYIPWLPTLYRQMTTVSASYWIQPLTIRSIFGCVKFLYLPVSGDGNINYILAILMILMTLLVTAGFLYLKPGYKDVLTGMSGYIVLGMVILIGFIFSIINRPIFVYRYMIPTLGVYYFSLAFMIGFILKKLLKTANTSKQYVFCALLLTGIIVLIAMTGKHHFNGFFYEENVKVDNMPKTYEALNNIEAGSVVITNFDQVTFLMDYYLPKRDVNYDIYLYEGETDPIVQLIVGKNQFLSEKDAPSLIKDAINEGRNVYFIGSFNSREDILDSWTTEGIEGHEEASVLLERYWFNVYQLSM